MLSQDRDNKDQSAIHVFGVKNDNIIAYTRIFKPGDYFDNASIGRVLVAMSERNFNYGYDIMKASIDAIRNLYKVKVIELSAQTYLKRFYNNIGFCNKKYGLLEFMGGLFWDPSLYKGPKGGSPPKKNLFFFDILLVNR